MTTATEPALIDQGDTADAAPLFLQPDAAAHAPRRATQDVKDMPATPDAPFGWMRDRETGEVRPRKTAGRQVPAKTGKRKGAPPPRNRAANRPRTARPPAARPPAATPAGVAVELPAAPVAEADHAYQVGAILDTLWMMGAAVPPATPGTRLLRGRIDVDALSVRSRASVAVLQANRATLAQNLGTVADHVPLFARGVEALAREDGPAWVFPVALALIPFAVQMGAIWKQPLADIRPLADETTQQFRSLAQDELRRAQAAQQAAQQAALAAQAPAPMAA